MSKIDDLNNQYKEAEGKVNDKAREIGGKFGVDKELVIAIAAVVLIAIAAKVFGA